MSKEKKREKKTEKHKSKKKVKRPESYHTNSISNNNNSFANPCCCNYDNFNRRKWHIE